MQKLVFDSGIREYQLGEGGVLRFNPSDPNVYNRFLEAAKKVTAVEKNLVTKAQALEGNDGAKVISLMAEADREIKKILGWVFGAENDFDKILSGVNLLAVGANGERVITNLLYTLAPIMQEGAESCAQKKIGAAVAQAKQNRQQRRAKK